MSDLKDMSMEMYRQWEKSMATWWDGLLDDPTVIKGMGDNLAAQSRVRKGFEDQVDTYHEEFRKYFVGRIKSEAKLDGAALKGIPTFAFEEESGGAVYIDADPLFAFECEAERDQMVCVDSELDEWEFARTAK